jgi:core-2/I-Branching enzyme
MKIACLVLAYTGAPVLAHSLPFLREAGWDVFVHLDRKADRARYASVLDSGALSFVDDPYEVFWGGYSMVQAELRLLKVAHDAGPYDKYLLISDDSFPVLPPDHLAAHFRNSRDQVILVRQRAESPFDRRYREFYCYDHLATTARTNGPRSCLVDEDLEHRIAEVAVLRRIGKKPLSIYFGSQFWALTRESAELVTRTAENDLHLAKSFQYSALPDELMVQSILGNYKYQENQHSGPMYADFSMPFGPRVMSTPADLPLDLQAPHAFLRKISPKATALLEHMSSNLRAGLTLHGVDAQEHKARATPAVVVGDSLHYRLTAPSASTAPGPAWHGIESFGGRTYRWTALEEISWQVPELPDLPEHCAKIRFLITPVIDSRAEFRQACQLTFSGRTLPLQLQEGNLIAEFPYSRSCKGTVVLKTPKLRSPHEASGMPDQRKLGLSIAT